LGFENKSGMYYNCRKPPFFHWRSTQMIFLFVLTMLNTALLIAGLIVKGVVKPSDLMVIIVFAAIIFFVQLAIPITYLCTREGQDVDRAVFGTCGEPDR